MILSIFACNAYPAAQRYCRQLIAAARTALPPIQYDAGWGQNRVKVVEGRESEGGESGCVHNAITGAAVSGMEQRRAAARRGGKQQSNSQCRQKYCPVSVLNLIERKVKTKTKIRSSITIAVGDYSRGPVLISDKFL